MTLDSRMRAIAGTLPLREGFVITNEFVGAFIKNISETITQANSLWRVDPRHWR